MTELLILFMAVRIYSHPKQNEVSNYTLIIVDFWSENLEQRLHQTQLVIFNKIQDKFCHATNKSKQQKRKIQEKKIFWLRNSFTHQQNLLLKNIQI